jgi:hypothetical protein
LNVSIALTALCILGVVLILMSVFFVGICVNTIPTAPRMRVLSISALSSLCGSAHHLCSPAWCHSPSPLALYLFCSPALCVERLESTARVRVGRLRGSPRSHLLSHLATIGVGRSPGPGLWSAAVVSAPPSDLASPLTRAVFHVAIPQVPGQLRYRKHLQSCIIAQFHLLQSLICLRALP